ncbi:MAG: DUF2155 domain-containing protein [Alphaproteobacteria bacterium]|nr:DUF2155 domain-containing protein [Alphaproteobacteria bacterium]
MALALSGSIGLSVPVRAETTPGEGAVLQGLDKVTARISEIIVRLDEPVRFGTLEITVRACHRTPPEEPPESTAYLEINDIRHGEAPNQVFAGWMFASTPGLNALEHAVYDVWVLDCVIAAGGGSPLPE